MVQRLESIISMQDLALTFKHIKAILLLFLFILLPGMNQTHARVFLRMEEVLSRYYNDCKIREENLFLNSEQIKKAEAISGLKIESKLLTRKIANCPSGEKYIYLDTHVVRTQKEVLLIVLGPIDLEKVEVLSFYEPEEYIPGKKWYELFKGIKKNDTVVLGGNIPHISGASLTSRATVSAVKKTVALHEAVSNVKK